MQDNTRQYKTIRDNTIHHRARQDNTKQYKTISDTAGQ